MKVKNNTGLSKEIPETVPLGSIDEYLAQKVLEGNGKTLRIGLSLDYNAGFLNILDISYEQTDFSDGMDFELSTCECQGVDDMDPGDFEGKTVYTSSAYEFFEFYLGERDSARFYIMLHNDSWIIKIDETSSGVGSDSPV